MNMNGNIFIALLHSREPVGGPLLVVAQGASRVVVLAVTDSAVVCLGSPRGG
jgi:hypothetical protein